MQTANTLEASNYPDELLPAGTSNKYRLFAARHMQLLVICCISIRLR
jgi:hypothetical protein